MVFPPFSRPPAVVEAPASTAQAPRGPITLSFNVPFSSNLEGPVLEEVLHASKDALERWQHAADAPEDTPTHKLPVHVENVEILRALCDEMSETEQPRVEATITVSEPKAATSLRRSMKGQVTNVCLTGEAEQVQRLRGKILQQTPVALRKAVVDIDYDHVIDADTNSARSSVIEYLDTVANFTGTNIFLLAPKMPDLETMSINTDSGLAQRLRIAIYGDLESTEHAKTRILIMIDQVLGRSIDAQKLELSLHTLICGRSRKNIKLIESATNTAIYFPPSFPQIYGYAPKDSLRRSPDEIFFTGDPENIKQAKRKLSDLVLSAQLFVKDVAISSPKIDNIILERLDKVKKIMENNGTFVQLPQLGSGRGLIRVQGTEILHIERTIREVMALAGQFYSASWWILLPEPNAAGVRAPSAADVRTMLSDICMNSGAEVSFDTKLTFNITGSDDAVKTALYVIYQIPFVNRASYQMKVKIELANEHKEFVSGKKNGKINKIMGQSNVQIIFDGFNEYNFYIDVCGSSYNSATLGLELVEQEMPASISFHVPDQYHKRIIGIGGQHIQRIMKKYSVFVKFSNAMDRGGSGKDEDDVKVDNVICRTPARNAANLDLVKQEIMGMVEQADAEYVQETVVINRLYHRELIAQMGRLEELEKKWNCKIIFPSTEMASDLVTIAGPEWQVPQAVDEFLGMIPESHEIVLPGSDKLKEFLKAEEFQKDIIDPLKSQYEVDLLAEGTKQDAPPDSESLLLTYTRNNAGGLKDAIDFVISRLVKRGVDATTIRGAIPRPKSDSFEESLPYFDSKLLPHAPAPLTAATPTKSSFVAESGRSFFDKLRRPSGMSSISSFLERRKNQAQNQTPFFKTGGLANGSRTSLASIESQHSLYRERNPWTDSGVNLPDDEHYPRLNYTGPKFVSGNNGSQYDIFGPTKFDTLGPLPNIGNSRPGTGTGNGFPSYMTRPL